MAAKDGTNRGGARPGAGRKKKALTEKIQEGKKATVMDVPELEGAEMPEIKDYLKAEQRMGELHAAEVQRMICDIFDGGNFGNKDSQRSRETLIISNRGKNGVGNTSMLSQLILSMNDIVYLKWGIAKKCKVLLPFGWAFYGGRYLVRAAMGKRPTINVKAMAEGAKERREIYKKFRLYEVDVE